MKYTVKHIMRKIEIMSIVISIFLCMILTVVPVSANSIGYDQLHHSYSIFHNSFIEQEHIPTIRMDNAVFAQDINIQ